MSTTLDIAKLIEMTAKLREESYDHKKADAERGTMDASSDFGHCIDYSAFYELSLEEAARKSCKELELNDELVTIVNLSLFTFWNDALDWSNRIIEKEKLKPE